MPSVSVVVPVLNGAGTIGDMLEALRQQSNVPPGTEFIVVDNGSIDGTREIVRKFGVTLLEEKKRGPAAARNRGLRHASGDVIVHLDADTLPTRNWLSEIVKPFDDPRVVLAVGRTFCFRPQTPAERYIAGAGLYESNRAISRLPFPFAPSLNMAVRRRAALAVGGWAEDLITAEDVDFSHRILRRFPGPIAYQANALLFHRTRSTVAGLKLLAWSYGQGVGRMYLRYPDEIRWSAWTTARVLGRLAARAIATAAFAAGRTFRLVTIDRAEFSLCHLFWSWYFFGGFFSVYYGRASGTP